MSDTPQTSEPSRQSIAEDLFIDVLNMSKEEWRAFVFEVHNAGNRQRLDAQTLEERTTEIEYLLDKYGIKTVRNAREQCRNERTETRPNYGVLPKTACAATAVLILVVVTVFIITNRRPEEYPRVAAHKEEPIIQRPMTRAQVTVPAKPTPVAPTPKPQPEPDDEPSTKQPTTPSESEPEPEPDITDDQRIAVLASEYGPEMDDRKKAATNGTIYDKATLSGTQGLANPPTSYSHQTTFGASLKQAKIDLQVSFGLSKTQPLLSLIDPTISITYSRNGSSSTAVDGDEFLSLMERTVVACRTVSFKITKSIRRSQNMCTIDVKHVYLDTHGKRLTARLTFDLAYINKRWSITTVDITNTDPPDAIDAH